MIDAENRLGFDRRRTPNQRVGDIEPSASLIHVAGKFSDSAYRLSFDFNQTITGFDSGACAGSVCFHPVGSYAAVPFHPAHTIVGSDKLRSFAEIDPRERYRSNGQQGKKPSRKSDLIIALHRSRRGRRTNQYTSPLGRMHVRCQRW